MIHTLGHGGAEKVLVNLVNNMNQEKFDITVMTIFDTGVNKQFLKKHIKYKYCFKHIFRGNIHFLKIFTPAFLYKHFIKDDYDIVVSYLEGPSARIISGCPNRDTKLVSWIHIQQYDKKNASRSFRSYEEAKKCYEKFNKIVYHLIKKPSCSKDGLLCHITQTDFPFLIAALQNLHIFVFCPSISCSYRTLMLSFLHRPQIPRPCAASSRIPLPRCDFDILTPLRITPQNYSEALAAFAAEAPAFDLAFPFADEAFLSDVAFDLASFLSDFASDSNL